MKEEYVKNIIEQRYALKVQNIEKIKNVYKIGSEGKFYCLKVIEYEFSHFFFIYSAIKHLQDKGFDKIPCFIKNVDGMEYIKIGNEHAYLTPWVNARESNYDNYFDIKNVTLKLAELHKKSQGFKVTPIMKPRIAWLRWTEIFTTRQNEIIDFRNRIGRTEKISEFDNYYLKLMDEELNRCNRTIEGLKSSNYVENMKIEIKKKGFCHHDYANHNVLIEDNGDIDIIDFDYCILDTHLHDLCSLIIRKMKDGKWSIENAVEIISMYSTLIPISKEDIPIMAAFIQFPQAYWQLGIQYYWEKKPWGEEFFMKKLRKIDLDKNEREEFVHELKNIKL